MGKQLLAGVIIALIVPFIGIFLIPVILKPDVFSLQVILDHFWMDKNFLPTIQLSIIPNLGVFFLLNKKNREIMARGVIAGTLFWGVYMMVLAFVV